MKNAQPVYPPQVPKLKTLSNILKFVKNPIPILNSYHQDHGDTFSFFVGGKNKGIVTIEPEIARQVLQKNHRNYIKTPILTEKLAYFIGNGLLTSNGDYWLQQRRLIQPGFHRERLSNLVLLMQEVVDRYMLVFEQASQEKREIDIYEYMLEVAFEIISKSIFSQSIDEDQLKKLSDNITDVQKFIIRQVRQPYLEWWLKLSGQRSMAKGISDASGDIILQFIKERRQSGKEVDDLLGMLLNTRYEDTGEGMTDEQLLEETIILFVAGHETSANALSWACYLLSQDPEVVRKIRSELDAVVGADGKPGFQQLPQLVYLRQVIEESMRLYPPAWITDRLAFGDDQMNNFKIDKGDTVIPYIYGIHRNPTYWPNPNRFDPDRFSPENRKQQVPYTYLPFGGGPRMCIGNNFAMMEMQLILAALLRRFDFELSPGQDLEPLPLITLRPKNGIRLKLIPIS